MKTVKLILVSLAAVLLTLPAMAGPVDVYRAGEAAKSFFKNDPVGSRRMAPVHRVELYSAPLTKAGESAPAFFFFNREGGGFVIIAGDDACKPILGYSFEGSLDSADQLPDGLRDWLNDFEAQVAQVRAEGTAPAREEWMAIEYPTKAGNEYKPAVYHETPAWNQHAPFNRLCPKVEGGESYVGCVPLAMGLVMNFFGYPAQGKGSLPSYDYQYDGKSYHVDGYELNYSYDWDKFQTVDFNKSYTDEQADAVARMLRDVGIAGQAWYLPGMTDCNFERIVPGVIDYFGYDSNVTHLRRWYFTDDQWMDMIKGDLQDHPLIYAANQESGGHAFVVDGYDKKNNLHINWGWGPKYNGYFALSAFIPVSGSNYKYAHTTVLGLVPDKGQGGYPTEYLYIGAAMGSDGVLYKGLTASATPERGQSFTMDVAWFFNGGLKDFNGKVCFALTDSDGNIIEKISGEKDVKNLKPRGGLGYFRIECKINAYPMEGDKVRLIYRSNNWPEGEWKVPLYRLDDGSIESVAVKADDSKLADVTSLHYDKTSGGVTLKTKDRVEWSLKKGTASVKEGVSSDFKISIPVSDLTKDTYTLTLKRGKEKQEITLKMGNK